MNIVEFYLVLLALVLLYSAYQWFYEIRFNLRKRIQSFDDYGRKRSLLKIRKKPYVMYGMFLIIFISLALAGWYLFEDFFYHWSLLLPAIPLNLIALAAVAHEKSFETIAIDYRFLDEEYFGVIEAEKNIEGFFQEIERLNQTLQAAKNRIQEKMNDTAKFFHQFEQRDYFDSQFQTIENQVFSQMDTQRNTIQKLKDNFVVIAQEYIENSRKVNLNQASAINVTKVVEYFNHIQSIEEQAIQEIIQWIRKAVSDQKLKSLSVYHQLVEHLSELGYQVTTDDVLVIFKNYPVQTIDDQEVYVDILYTHKLASISFFTQLVIPQELVWLLNDRFYDYFKTAEIKDIYAEILNVNSITLLDHILSDMNPKYIAYLSDIVIATNNQNVMGKKIRMYDELFRKLNQFLSHYNATENYFYALKPLADTDKSLKDFIHQVQDKDFSTPAIAEEIQSRYLAQFYSYRSLFSEAFDLYIIYDESLEKANHDGLLDGNIILELLLENIFKLQIPMVKLNLRLLIFNLYTMKIPWHMDPMHQKSVAQMMDTLELKLDVKNLDDLLISTPPAMYQKLVAQYAKKNNINKATLDQLVMRTEIHRETLDELR